MLRFLVVAALTLTCVQTAQAESKCNTYIARDDQDLRLVETTNEFTVSWEKFSETYKRTYSKSFGFVMDAGYNGDGPNPETHIFKHDKIDGKDVIILDSIVMFPSCGKRSGVGR